MVRHIVMVFPLCLVLAGCAGGPVVNTCPLLKVYSHEEELKVARDLEAIGKSEAEGQEWEIDDWIGDYYQLREMLIPCQPRIALVSDEHNVVAGRPA